MNSFRVKWKGKFKIFLFHIRQVGQMVTSQIINIRTNIKRQSKKIKFKIGVRIVATSITFGAVLPLPFPVQKPETYRMHEEAQIPIERLMPNPYVRFDDVIQERIEMDETEVVASLYPQLTFRGDLFGRSLKVSGGDLPESLNELQKLSFRPNYSELIKYGLEHRGALPTTIKAICTHNQFIRNYVSQNFANQVFQNPDYEIFQNFGIPALKLLLLEIPRNFRYNFPVGLPGVRGFVQPIPRHRQLGGKLNEDQISLYMGKPKMSKAELFKVVNRKGDPKTGKIEIRSSITEDNTLRKIFQDAALNPKTLKHINSLIDRLQSGDLNIGSGTKKIDKVGLIEVRAADGTRLLVDRIDKNVLEVFAVFPKAKQDRVFDLLEK